MHTSKCLCYAHKIQIQYSLLIEVKSQCLWFYLACAISRSCQKKILFWDHFAFFPFLLWRLWLLFAGKLNDWPIHAQHKHRLVIHTIHVMWFLVQWSLSTKIHSCCFQIHQCYLYGMALRCPFRSIKFYFASFFTFETMFFTSIFIYPFL